MSKPERTFIIGGLALVLIIVLTLIIIPQGTRDSADFSNFSLNHKLTISDLDIIDGRAEAKLAIVVYENYLDNFSYQLLASLDQAKAEFSDELLFIYRPLVVNNNQAAFSAALLVGCAHQAGAGLAARQLLFSQGLANFSLTKIEHYADQLSLSKQKLLDCLNSADQRTALDNWQQAMRADNIIGSPTILINDEIIIGARPYNDFIDSNDDKIEGLRSIIIRNLEE